MSINEMDSKLLQVLVYLWTRDANFHVEDKTEQYIVRQLKAIQECGCDTAKFCDGPRAEMAQRIASQVLMGALPQ